MSKKPEFKLDVDTESLIAFLLARHKELPNEHVTYAEMSKIISRKVNNGARHILSGARKVLARDHDILTDSVRNVGIAFVCENVDVLGMVESHQSRIRRANKRTLNIVRHVDMDNATDEEKSKALAVQSIVGAIELCTRKGNKEKIMIACKDLGTAVSIGRTLEIFKQ